MIYDRITRIVKYSSEGVESKFDGSIKIEIFNVVKAEDFEKTTWENANAEEEEDESYDYQEIYENNSQISIKKKRPAIEDHLIPKNDIIIYSESVKFDENAEKLRECESYKRVLLNEDEISIYGFPTQFILTHFKNNCEELNHLIKSNSSNYSFKINNKKHDEKFTVSFTNIEKVYELITKSKEIILKRDFLLINQKITLGKDFISDELTVLNNFQRNPVLDRKLNFQEIISKINNYLAHMNKKTFTNVDSLIIQPQHKKALECVIIGNKIGIFSELWKEKIETKLETIIKMKFYILYRKMKNLLKHYNELKSQLEIIKEDENVTSEIKANIDNPEASFFRYLNSTQGVIQDEWDSDKDLLDQANKKAYIYLK